MCMFVLVPRSEHPVNEDLRHQFDDAASQTNKAFTHVRQVHGRSGGEESEGGQHEDGEVSESSVWLMFKRKR